MYLAMTATMTPAAPDNNRHFQSTGHRRATRSGFYPLPPVTHGHLRQAVAGAVHQDKLAVGITDLPSWS